MRVEVRESGVVDGEPVAVEATELLGVADGVDVDEASVVRERVDETDLVGVTDGVEVMEAVGVTGGVGAEEVVRVSDGVTDGESVAEGV